MNLNVDFDHKKKHTAVEAELKYGKNMKDKTKRFFLGTSLNKKELSWKKAMLTFKLNAEAPEYVSIGIFLINILL